MTGSDAFTNEELLAYSEERLLAERAAEIERQLRGSPELMSRLVRLLQEVERGDLSLGGMWRRGRWSCPSRAVWAAFVAGRLGDGLAQYLRFHLERVGCRMCAASVTDLQAVTGEDDARVRKIFQSSAGALRPSRTENLTVHGARSDPTQDIASTPPPVRQAPRTAPGLPEIP